MNLIKPPSPLVYGKCNIFLAGSIEMGVAENWQDRLANALANTDVTIFNPRRDDWDSSWVQDINNVQFNEQVTWELTALENSDIIAMYFDPTTKSPISLLELGLYAESGRMIVCCPEGFWRKGNVDIVCDRYGVPVVTDMDSLLLFVRNTVKELI